MGIPRVIGPTTSGAVDQRTKVVNVSIQISSHEPILDSQPPRIYKYSCHTCNLHFPTETSYENHILESDVHKSFKLSIGAADDLGYLCALGVNIGPESDQGNSSHWLRDIGLGPCTKCDCICPQFEFVPPGRRSPVFITGELSEYPLLDGAAGSTLQGEMGDEEEGYKITLHTAKQPGSSAVEDEGPYATLSGPNNKKDIIAAKREQREEEARKAKITARFEKRKRLTAARAEKERAKRAIQEEILAQGTPEEVEVPRHTRARRYKPSPMEIALAKEKEEAEVARWQKEVGIVDFRLEEKRRLNELTKQIHTLINDTLLEVAFQRKSEQCEKEGIVAKYALFFEDEYEDFALDYELSVEDRTMEALRRMKGAELTRRIYNAEATDQVDELVLDHVQDVVERGAEKRRREVGREQTKIIYSLKMDNIMQDMALDHHQEVLERQEEVKRRAFGSEQTRELFAHQVDDVVETMAVDFSQGLAEGEEERRRREVGGNQTRNIYQARMNDTVDNVVLDLTQAIDKRMEEDHLRNTAAAQMRESSDLWAGKVIDDIVLTHEKEAANRPEERDRSVDGQGSTKRVKHTDVRGDNTAVEFASNYAQEADENTNTNQKNIPGLPQSAQANLASKSMVEGLLFENAQCTSESDQQRVRSVIGIYQARNKEAAGFLAKYKSLSTPKAPEHDTLSDSDATMILPEEEDGKSSRHGSLDPPDVSATSDNDYESSEDDLFPRAKKTTKEALAAAQAKYDAMLNEVATAAGF